MDFQAQFLDKVFGDPHPLTSPFPKRKKNSRNPWLDPAQAPHQHIKLLQPTFEMSPESLKKHLLEETSPVTTEIFGYELMPHTFVIWTTATEVLNLDLDI